MTNRDYMLRALKIARMGRTSPNPMVGAVVVKNGVVVGEGYHPKAGDPHAEIFALRDAKTEAKGAVMYVTLEPCCHQGRTPPCTKALIEAGISEVYVAMVDPDPKVASQGLDELRKAGIKVYYPLCEDEARSLNEAYIKHRTTGMPFVILKSAMSLDGKIATRTGDSKWITNERSRAYAHKIRSQVDAIVVGANTARADDPALSARIGKKAYYPTRVIVTNTGDLPDNLKMFALPGETIIAASSSAKSCNFMKLERAGARIITLRMVDDQPSMADLMQQLAGMGYLSALIEGGGEVAASSLSEQIVDKVLYFYAPKIIGGREAISSVGGIGSELVTDAIQLDRIRVRRFGDDIAIEGYVKRDN